MPITAASIQTVSHPHTFDGTTSTTDYLLDFGSDDSVVMTEVSSQTARSDRYSYFSTSAPGLSAAEVAALTHVDPRFAEAGGTTGDESPDRSETAYFSAPSQLHLHSSAGGADTIIAGGGIDLRTAFSNDGARLLYTGPTTYGSSSIDELYIRNLASAATTLVSSNAAGVAANGDAETGRFSPDGDSIVFYSDATNLTPQVAGPVTGIHQIYVKNLLSGAVSLVSQTADGTPLDGDLRDASFSPDGTLVLFHRTIYAQNNGQDVSSIYLKNLQTGELSTIPTGVSVQLAEWSPDGRSIAVEGLDASRNETVRLLTLSGVQTPGNGPTLVSSSAVGVEGNRGSLLAGSSSAPSTTGDGTGVLFASDATNLVANDTNGRTDLFLKDVSTGAVTLVSANAAGVQQNGFVGAAAISADGTLVALSSSATNLDPRATDSSAHLYLKNVSTGALTLVTPSDYVIRNATSGAIESAANFIVLADASISADGRYLTAQARTTTGSHASALVFDTATHTALDLNGLTGSGGFARVSADSSTVVFSTNTALVAADTDAANDIYAYSFADGSLQLVDTSPGGNTADVKANGDSLFPSVSADASRVAFQSTATNLDYRDTDSINDVYVKDVGLDGLFLADVTAGGVKSNADALNASISPDGRYVVFVSAATNLAPGATDGAYHAYVKDLDGGMLTLLDVSASGVAGNADVSEATFAADGAHIVFQSDATNLVANDTNGASDVFIVPLPASAPPPANTAPLIGGTVAGQAVTDKATVQPFSTATVADPDAGQTETVTVTYTAANGTLSAGGFTGAAGGYSGAFTSAAAAQAALQALVFTPTANETAPGQSVTTGFTIAVNDGQATATNTGASVVAASVNDAPVLGGIAASHAATAGAPSTPFATATVADPDTGQTETVTVSFAAGSGAFAGAGFTGANGVFSGTFATAAAAQAALRASTFTPTAGAAASDTLTVAVQDAPGGGAPATASTTLAVGFTPAPPPNTPPAIGGTQAGQADTAGTAISPFSTVTVTDPDAGQSETVTVSFAAGNGVLAGGDFVQTAPGVYAVSAASASAAQAALRAASFTPTAGQSSTTAFALTVSDGQATAADSSTSVVAAYTPAAPPTGGGGSGGGGGVITTTTTPPSVQAGLVTELQNLERALANGVDALTPGTPVNAAFAAYKAVADQLDNGRLTLAQAEASLAHLVDGTTAVAVADYAFFTGFTPTTQGLNYLVHSPANATDLNDPYYARFSTENRYINFAVNLATGPGAGAAAFQANYGALSLADATAKAYAAVFGAPADAAKVSALLDTLVPDGLGGQETRAQYFAQYGGDGPSGQGTKAAAVGFLLAQAVHDGSGVYGAATEHYLSALAHGQAPAFGSELALTYGPAVSLVGTAPVADPTITG